MQTRFLSPTVGALLVALTTTGASADELSSESIDAPPPLAVFSLKNLGFPTFDAQRDAADAILRSSSVAASTPDQTTRNAGVTILRWFTGGNSLLGDALSRRQVTE